ncbi:hypothetical protein ACI2UC_14590 [Ralstonia nicotianae]|uniref:Uncharacterized protein n=1 Tax=Ralstonia syzygii TaxID=28097 RepID=A0ABX7ZAF3_9RALS|nr:hypothetical protein [Ralstonia syzygii]QUP52423.1 hypothetical protein GO998_00890 [Ralstonia syzygii]
MLQFVTAEGSVARFVFNKRDLFADGRPKPKVFGPEWHPSFERYETSVCGLNGTTDVRLWDLGCTVRASSDLTAIAVVDIHVADVVAAGLSCEPAPEKDYAEHGVILGWDNEPEAKDKRLAVQQDLVARLCAEAVRRRPSHSS